MLQNAIFSYRLINGSVIKSSNCEKLLEITTDSDFAFENHINTSCRKVSHKLYVLLS